MRCKTDVKVCRECVGWLRDQTSAPSSTPILPVRDMAEAVAFYESAGFHVRLYEDGGFAFVHLDDESVFDLGLEEQMKTELNLSGCGLIVAGVDEWHDELAALGFPVTAPEDQPWEMREFTLTDPSGNRVRIMQTR
ncbi:MAG: VOC family protein [Acidimicrobiales bacterium]